MKNHILIATAAVALSFAAAAPAQIVVRIGPPPPRPVEVVPFAPVEHRDWVWRPGYHRWDGARYVWVPGEYIAPPRPHARWVPGHWAERGGGWVWIEGHWR